MTENLVSPNKSSNFAAAFEKTRPLGVENKKAKVVIESLINQDVVQASTPYYIYRVAHWGKYDAIPLCIVH